MKKILNIVGPQGCGKTALAETIAAFIGGVTARATPRDLDSKFTPYLRGAPSVVLVEAEQGMTCDELCTLKGLAVSTSLVAQLPDEWAAVVATPRFIVCSEQLISNADDRRVLVIGGGT